MLKEKILEYFMKNDEQITLSKLSTEFNVSRNACWKAINKLIDDGYEIHADKKKGYTFKNNDILSITSVNLYSKYFKCVKVFDSIDSTNTYMKSLNDLENNTVIVSNMQTNGRGRRGKSFISEKGKGAYFTFYIKDYIDTGDITFITICTAVAIRRCLNEVYNLNTDIKWLNDIYYKGKKLAGILTEATLSAEELCANELFIGIGINTLQVSDSIADFATSLEEALNLKINRSELIGNILNYFKIVYDECFKNNGKYKILKEYKSYQFIIGMQVKVERHGEISNATVKSINDYAELIVEINNQEFILNSGTIILKGENDEC
ncbi:MAG: biotin--[acetyl-CoA-carboxylase] ligase [Bacilli bacterium]